SAWLLLRPVIPLRVLVEGVAVPTAVVEGPLDPQVVDQHTQAGLLAIARLSPWRALRAGRVVPPIGIAPALDPVVRAQLICPARHGSLLPHDMRAELFLGPLRRRVPVRASRLGDVVGITGRVPRYFTGCAQRFRQVGHEMPLSIPTTPEAAR